MLNVDLFLHSESRKIESKFYKTIEIDFFLTMIFSKNEKDSPIRVPFLFLIVCNY